MNSHLPIFPTFYDMPTEDKLERTIERLFNRADNVLTEGQCTQAEYDLWTNRLKEWEAQYK